MSILNGIAGTVGGGGEICPKHATTSWMASKLLILHLIFSFGVKNHSKISYGVVKIEANNFEIKFFQKISYIIVLFDSKYEFRMISAFI